MCIRDRTWTGKSSTGASGYDGSGSCSPSARDLSLIHIFGDPRTDQRIRFVGGSHKLSELAEIADKTGGVAFAMFPTAMEDLMQIADENKLMPPKSTWFEPKLRSGLFIHKLS